MNNLKVTALSLVVATAIGFTGCGGGSSSSTPAATTTPTTTPVAVVDGTLVKTAYDYFVKDNKIDITSTGSVAYNTKTAVSGVDETKIWKGKAGSNDPIEDYTYTKTTGYSSPCTARNIDINLSSDITTNMTLDPTKVYGINGRVRVKNGAVITAPAGTTFAGATPSSFMVFTAGTKLIANGTLAKPIVFTSNKDLECKSADNLAGEWGGLVLVGTAYAHYSNNTYEADPSIAFGSTNHTHDTDSSGSLKYVAVKHSGFAVQKDKELNGLSLAGVGSGTTIENIAIIGGFDDGIEIWGGTVNLTNVYVYNAQDDSTDTDLGYRGKFTNVLARQVNVDKTNNHDSSCMEFGNDQNTITTDDSNATQPDVTNYTCYAKGGGLYNKYDAGFIWNNVKFVSDKTVDFEQVHFRGADSYDSGAKHITGPVSFYDSKVVLTKENTYSRKNSKAQ